MEWMKSTNQKNLRIPKSTQAEEQHLKEMLRVDHAGELGAVRIYDGQLAGLAFHPKSASTKRQIRHMHQQEKEHLAEFNQTLPARNVRPTALQPFWHVAGGSLGFATAILGEKFAHACTAAVETVIDHHYEEQIQLVRKEGDHKLADTLKKFQAEEVEHKDLAISQGAEDIPFYGMFRQVVELGCRTAIRLSEKI
jgi:ubiquinone biosynthesis monooxygenase Coq7|tara:strand:- start:4964 stop:5548 length:585 start_codon:yes stop_codon:yes gene_type:complete